MPINNDLETSRIAHLGFIQGVINRMGNNSFLLKGWTITIIAALFALSAKDANAKFIDITYLPACMFWLLDAYFLLHERLFRELYEKIAIESNYVVPNYSMKVEGFNPFRWDSWGNLFKTFISFTLISFYLPIVIILAIVTYVT